jgi:tetratricopeptide (TPR) repeat protein
VRKPRTVCGWLLTLTIITTLTGAGAALAECTPGQLQEAGLAYSAVAPLIETQSWDQAIPRLQSIVEICPEYFPALRSLGDAYMGSGQAPLAERAYQQLIEVRGSEAEAPDYAALAKALASQKKYSEARAEYIKAQELAPDDCGVLFNLGVLHMASGFTVQAVNALEHAEEVCPHLRERVLPQLHKACTMAAEQQRKIGNAEKAEYYASLAREYGGSAGGTTTYNMGAAAMKQGNFVEAVKLFQKVVSDNPNHANGWLSLARARDAAGDDAGSVDAYKEYLKLKPDNLREIVSLILVQSELGRCAEAQSTASLAVNRHQSLGARAIGKLHFAWGKALECARQYEEARGQFQQCAASDDPEWVPRALQEIERMNQHIEYERRKAQRAAQGG